MLRMREDAIVVAVNRLLATKGYDAMTVDEVAAEAGLAKASLYKHFTSKEELAGAAMVAVLDRALAFVDGLRSQAQLAAVRPVDQLKAVARWAMQTQLEGEMPSLPSQNSSLSESLKSNDAYMDRLIDLSNKLSIWIAEAQTSGQINPSLPAGLDPILKKALEKDLYNRYRNGAELAKDLAAVRYQILEDNDPVEDDRHFKELRVLPFFLEFEDIEIWEALRFCVWRNVAEKVTLLAEGDETRSFGIIVQGFVEVSTDGKSICRLGPGEVVGEMAFLHPKTAKRHASVVTLEPTVFLEVNPSALALASEEVQERFQKVLIERVLKRLTEADRILAKMGQNAVTSHGSAPPASDGKFDLELLP